MGELGRTIPATGVTGRIGRPPAFTASRAETGRR
jgi:hypothetical protein